MSGHREMLLPESLNNGHEKALRKQGSSILSTTPTKALQEVEGDYTRFSDIAIGCMQFVKREPVEAFLRVGKTRQCEGLRLSINGRGGGAECFFTCAEQVDALIERLEVLKVMQFGDVGVIE